ncbi:hypothetical protein PV325_009682 [Microctonus aethiopoides]|nr:hypothetical protein PV325_009682 [Microctonus aethiopoides]
MQYDPLDEDSDMGHRLYNVCNRLSIVTSLPSRGISLGEAMDSKKNYRVMKKNNEEKLRKAARRRMMEEGCPSGFAGREESG